MDDTNWRGLMMAVSVCTAIIRWLLWPVKSAASLPSASGGTTIIVGDNSTAVIVLNTPQPSIVVVKTPPTASGLP
jgi:hypothetical protein